jgi:hypothetical protein
VGAEIKPPRPARRQPGLASAILPCYATLLLRGDSSFGPNVRGSCYGNALTGRFGRRGVCGVGGCVCGDEGWLVQ